MINGCNPAPTWSGEVAPVVAERCAGCHQDGGIGPFDATRYEHAAPMAAAIAAATSSRTMPPWLADGSGTCGHFKDSEWLDDETLAMFSEWSLADAPAGDATVRATPPIAADLDGTVTELDPGADYTPRPNADDHRCFIVDPDIDGPRFITGYQVVPGDATLVHHVIVYALGSEDADDVVAMFDARDEGPGYDCIGTANAYPQWQIASWAPGLPPTLYPEGTGIRIEPDHALVIQIHYHTEDETGPDRTIVRLQTAESVPNEARVIALADFAMRLPPGQAEATATLEAPLNLDYGFFVRAAFPHMHTRGRGFRLDVEHDGERRCIAELPRWDFNWQRMYLYSVPPFVASTDTLRMTCTFDTTDTTEEVLWGESTDDEMCLLGLLVTRFP